MSAQQSRDIQTAFKERYGAEPQLFRAPGRVNLIGEHTDYNDGFVLPAALDLATFVAIAPRHDRLIRVHSLDLNAEFDFSLDVEQQRRGDWSDYVRGVAIEIETAGYRLRGADISVKSMLPMGAGLSTSAALEVAIGCSLLTVSGATVDWLRLAKICQRAENDFVGMRCGIMDQYASCFGVAGAALLLDCRSLESRPVRIDPRVRIVIANTMVHHQLASSAFNLRREECERAVALLSDALEGVRSLRDVTADQLRRHAALLPDPIQRRAQHVVEENERVLSTVAALEAGDFATCGQLMNASHESLRDNYEVSCAELDLMVELARMAPGVHGARMTGGGFGGCTVSLVGANQAERFSETVAPAYEKVTGLSPQIFSCYPGAGAGPVHL